MKVKRGVEATVDFAVAEPAQVALLTAHAEVADRDLGKAVVAARGKVVELLRQGRRYPGAASLPEITEEALVGAISTVLAHALLDGALTEVDELRSQLVQFALIFY